ncbi:MAG: cbb3-type cytochrome c oxidase subunit I [bacterium]
MSTDVRVDDSHSTEPAVRTVMVLWFGTILAVFAVMIIFGITMRLEQSQTLEVGIPMFYALMTMHGLGMVGATFSAGLAMIWFITARYAKPNVALMRFSWGVFTLGALGLLAATLVGRFGAGWYALYPLPFQNPTWPQWSIGVAIISLMLLGVSWLVCQLDILRALAGRYGASKLLGWQYFSAAKPTEELPPSVLIVVICAAAGILGTLAGAATFVIYLFKWLAPQTNFDVLLLKNTMFLFGHVIVNLAMYCGIAAVYEFLPSYTKRSWSLNRVTVLAWNTTLIFILGAYFHHLYVDFAQPTALQYAGQILSYLSAIPATAVTVFGVGSQVFGSGLRWTFTPLAFFLGILGWVIGGIAAVVDSTIAINQIFHNTLWVPAHFHTYFLVGFVFIMLGFAHRFVASNAERLATGSLWAMVVGGYGFVLMFYLGGLSSVPRRYANYGALSFGSIAETGAHLALGGAVFAVIFLLGIIGFYVSLAKGRTTTPALK